MFDVFEPAYDSKDDDEEIHTGCNIGIFLLEKFENRDSAPGRWITGAGERLMSKSLVRQ